MTVILSTVSRIFNKGWVQKREAKLGKNQRPEELLVGTLFFWTQQNKASPSTSGNSVTHAWGSGYGGVTMAAVSAQSASQH